MTGEVFSKPCFLKNKLNISSLAVAYYKKRVAFVKLLQSFFQSVVNRCPHRTQQIVLSLAADIDDPKLLRFSLFWKDCLRNIREKSAKQPFQLISCHTDIKILFFYNNYYGIFNYLGKSLGILDKNINWLGDERFALGCIILILLTTSVGQPIVLYVSALGNVDQSIVEAAEVDGATDFQCFWKIKWPAIMPTTLYILVITTINSFQCFALIQLLTSGGPNHKTDTIMYYIYYTAFKQYKYGYGNAMGVVLAVIIAILSAVQFKMGNKDN